MITKRISCLCQDLSMNKGFTYHDAFVEYQFTFLSNAYECDQVFIPMNEKNEEWYLLVISLKERTVYICDCCSAQNINETHMQSTVHMMEFTTKMFKLIYEHNNRSNDYPDIASFAMKFPETMQLENKHASGLWVCSWIKNECRFPFHDYGVSIIFHSIRSCNFDIQYVLYIFQTMLCLQPFRLIDRKELVVELVMELTNFKRKKLLTRLMKHKTCERARRHLDYNR
ncbi:hypothetical protein LINPERPRIM_LOCUS40892 [Linum perenne]